MSTMEITRTPEIQPDRDGGKRWPSGRRRGAPPARKRPSSDSPDTGPETAPEDTRTGPEDTGAEPADATAPSSAARPHRVDVTV